MLVVVFDNQFSTTTLFPASGGKKCKAGRVFAQGDNGSQLLEQPSSPSL
jgi:hypothetical protein